MFWPKLQSVASPIPEIIAIVLLRWGLGVASPQSWGRKGCWGSGMVPFERVLVGDGKFLGPK